MKKARSQMAETRRANLKIWFSDKQLPEKDKSFISQLISGKTESFGEKAARRLERDHGIPDLFLDNPNIANTDLTNAKFSGGTISITTANKISHGGQLIAQSEQDGNHKHRIDYLDVRAAAGLVGFENSDYPEIVSSLFLSDEGILQILGRKSAAGIKIVNVPTDSMEPTIRKGDWVFLDTNIDYYNGDGVYAFAIDDALFIKRIQKLVGGGYRLHSDNKDYDPQDITDEIYQTAKFVGRFIKTIHIDVATL
jgi:putative transcriptional regulator|nr:MAG TPA: Repressor protein CI [Bacteriophage sp.]